MPNDRIRAKMNVPDKIFLKKMCIEHNGALSLSVYLLSHLKYKKFKHRAISIYRNKNYTPLKDLFVDYKGKYVPEEFAPNDRQGNEMI